MFSQSEEKILKTANNHEQPRTNHGLFRSISIYGTETIDHKHILVHYSITRHTCNVKRSRVYTSLSNKITYFWLLISSFSAWWPVEAGPRISTISLFYKLMKMRMFKNIHWQSLLSSRFTSNDNLDTTSPHS